MGAVAVQDGYCPVYRGLSGLMSTGALFRTRLEERASHIYLREILI